MGFHIVNAYLKLTSNTLIKAGPMGFEPMVSGSGGRCIIHSATGPQRIGIRMMIKGFP